MHLSEEQRSLLWLSAAKITPSHVTALAQAYGGPEGVWDAFGSRGGPEFPEQVRSTLSTLHSCHAMDGLIARLEQKNVRLLFRDDERYPGQLAKLDDAPYLLYYAGSLDCLKRPMVALVGTRRCSAYGREMASMLARCLCDAGVCVVSGLARGIDLAVHESALEAGGYTVGVLGSGINVPYPPEHRPLLRKIAGGIGLVLSEYPLDARPLPYHFPHRNRIISGLSLGVVFVEGRIRSGGIITVDTALSQGREVFAVPGCVGTAGAEGPNHILREGGRIVTCADDVLEDLGLAPGGAAPEPDETEGLTDLQRRILDLLALEPLGAQELGERLMLDASRLLAELGTLEIMGLICRESGNRFRRTLQAGNQRRS